MPEVEFTPTAAALLLKIRMEHPNLVLLIDDSSCCSNSNIIARANKPKWPVALVSNKDHVEIYMNPILQKSLRTDRILIDVLDFADDSFSLETDYGKRFVMTVM